jgi:hypothetical protein
MSRNNYVDAEFFGMPRGTKVGPLGGGRNSQVFLVEPPGREPIVFKRYFVDPRDKRDRQGAEARALRFLERAGVNEAPLLLTLDLDRQASMLTYVVGEKIDTISKADIGYAAEFLKTLIRLSRTEMAPREEFSPASEAFFSAAEVVENVELRLARLENAGSDCPLCEELAEFLGEGLRPALVRHAEACRERLTKAGMGMHRAIPEEWRILSPSDFGMHNALRRPEGNLAFFDYEYFGWDDPSKTLADFCLHPAMNLPGELQKLFLDAVVPELEAGGYRRERAGAMFPLFGLKWCCILLNEFVPKDQARRMFAGQAGNDGRTPVLQRQLGKARALLNGLDRRAEVFAALLGVEL